MEPYLGEIRIFGFNWAPNGWALCDGSILKMSQNQALGALLNKTYGGDGVNTFGLPDLRGRTPLAAGRAAGGLISYNYGDKGGAETVTLAITDIPSHNHAVDATTADATAPVPGNANQFAQVAANTPLYGVADNNPPTLTALASTTITSAGGGEGHDNMQPYLTVNFCIAISNALWPPRS
ncbi:MAG: phage tail protein [Alphaproteobacteria bacterium]|nr:phage tail protein [Alphaproteobacteria bacterium]